MVDPFLPTVRLLVAKSSPSVICTYAPVDGVAGRLIVNVPLPVSAIKRSPLDAVYGPEILRDHVLLPLPPVPAEPV